MNGTHAHSLTRLVPYEDTRTVSNSPTPITHSCVPVRNLNVVIVVIVWAVLWQWRGQMQPVWWVCDVCVDC